MSIVAREPCLSCQPLFDAERKRIDNTKAYLKAAVANINAETHRTAIDLVLAHLAQAKELWHGMPASPEAVISMLVYNLKAMRDWTPEHAAEVLAEAMTDRARR